MGGTVFFQERHPVEKYHLNEDGGRGGEGEGGGGGRGKGRGGVAGSFGNYIK